MTEQNTQRQPLEEAIYDYRKRNPGPLPDFDAKFVLDILHQVNDASCIRIAIDPVTKNGWNRDARTFGVTGVYVSADSKLVFKIHSDKKTLTADEAYDRISRELKRRPNKHIPVAFEYKEEIVKLTDAYSHSLVRDMWAGLPFDVVLAQTTPDAFKEDSKEDA